MSSNLFSFYTLSFPFDNSVGVISSSLPLSPGGIPVENHIDEKAHLSDGHSSSKEFAATAHPVYLLYSRLGQNMQVESLYARRFAYWQNLLILSGATHWNQGMSHMNAQLVSNPFPDLCLETLYSSDNQTIGGSALASISKNWALGFEVLFPSSKYVRHIIPSWKRVAGFLWAVDTSGR